MTAMASLTRSGRRRSPRHGARAGPSSGPPSRPVPGRCRRARRGAGFTYLGLVILLAIMALVAAASLKAGAMVQRAAAERELLHIGGQFCDALQSYAAATPPGQPRQPPSLKELLRDPRYPGIVRHLRKVFVDPMTGRAEWGMAYAAGTTGVVAVYSLSGARTVKVANFPARFQAFEGKQRIADWKFACGGDIPPPPLSSSGPPLNVRADSPGALPPGLPGAR